MGMAAEQQVEIGVGGLAIDLRRVRQEDGELVVRDLRGRLLDVVHAVVMGVVDAGEMDRARRRARSISLSLSSMRMPIASMPGTMRIVS